MSLFSVDPFSTLRADNLFLSDFKEVHFKACPPTFDISLNLIDKYSFIDTYIMRDDDAWNGDVITNTYAFTVSCAGGYDNAIAMMINHLKQYVLYGPDSTTFVSALNGVSEGGDNSEGYQLNPLKYKKRTGEDVVSDEGQIESCDDSYAELQWVDYPSAGYLCAASAAQMLDYELRQLFTLDDYEEVCEDCSTGEIIGDILEDIEKWWEDESLDDPFAPVDCEMAEWTKWGECVNGRQRRTRTVITWHENEGTPCGDTDEQRTCTGCEATDWSKWGDCVSGTQERTKMVKKESEDEQAACVEMKEVRSCSATSDEEPTESKLPLYLGIAALGVVALNMAG